MALNENPTTVVRAPMHYVCIEKIGPIQKSAQAAWQELPAVKAELASNNEITGGMSLYTITPMSYRAGHSIAHAPKHLPAAMKYIHHQGGKFLCFVLTGSYSQLPAACGRVFELVKLIGAPAREDYYIEDYVNNPSTTPKSELMTHILIPAA